jgi:uncharacterized protein (TIGR00369 family)
LTHGRAIVVLERSIWPLNPNGAVHGGLVLAAADHIMGMAAMSTMEPGQICATATLGSQFLRPAMAPLLFDASVERAGRTLAFVELTVAGEHRRSCVRASGAWAINRMPPA